MTKEITMPRLSETMKDGKIVSWNKKPGDRVNKGDIIAEVETDKANMEIEAVDSGTLSEILVNEGNIANVGAPIATLNGKAKVTPTPADIGIPEKRFEEKTEPKAKVIKEEKLPQSRKEEIIKEEPIKKKAIPEFQYNPEIETQPEETKQINITLAAIKASPRARRLAINNNIDLSQVQGTGPGGRITESDVQHHLELKQEPAPQAKEQAPSPKQMPSEDVESVPISRMRLTIGQRMLESKQNVPHFYVTYEVYADNLVEYEKRVHEKIDPDITFNDIFVKAASIILRRYPMFNAEFRGDHIDIQKRINIGIAFAVEAGLLVPVVHDCDKKNLKEISEATKIIKDRVKNNKLQPEDMTGGTFSISNMGMYGVKEFAPIINPPESAGLAIGAIMKAAIVKDDQVAVGNTVNLTLSADHRVVDGAEAARFLKDLKDLLENPDQIETA